MWLNRFYFLFCFAFSPPNRREVFNSLFSIFRNKICPLISRKYHLIVLKNNIVHISSMLSIPQNDLKILWFCATIWQNFISDRVLNLKGKWKLGPTKLDFQTPIVLICTFLYSLWKFSTFKNSVISADAESLLFSHLSPVHYLYLWCSSKLWYLLHYFNHYFHASVNNFWATDPFLWIKMVTHRKVKVNMER